MAGVSFTTTYNNGLSNVLKNKVKIRDTLIPNLAEGPKEWVALWDTGATNSVITNKVVSSLGLKPVSLGKAYTPQGEYTAYKYYIDLTLPNGVTINKLIVMEGTPFGCDILIGMDVIGRGDFAVSNHQGITSFSFRMPSLSKIDFVNNSYMSPQRKLVEPSRNTRCPCGSGKKYKNCCGKQ